jgi:hypothetical protein
MELLDSCVTVKLCVDCARVCICHFVASEQLQSSKQGLYSMRLVSVYLCLVRIVEVMLQFESK